MRVSVTLFDLFRHGTSACGRLARVRGVRTTIRRGMESHRDMHELSIVAGIVDAVTEVLTEYRGARVKEVRLRIGALAAVVEESLQFCYGIATDDTPLAGSTLIVEHVPVLAHCAACACDGPIESLQSFRCARCGTPVNDVLQGRELEIACFEIEEALEKV